MRQASSFSLRPETMQALQLMIQRLKNLPANNENRSRFDKGRGITFNSFVETSIEWMLETLENNLEGS